MFAADCQGQCSGARAQEQVSAGPAEFSMVQRPGAESARQLMEDSSPSTRVYLDFQPDYLKGESRLNE